MNEEKQALNLAARIAIQMDEYENVDVQTFAHAVAFILKSEYGHHNYYNFIQSLNSNFYGN
jgi:hypothetical protein